MFKRSFLSIFIFSFLIALAVATNPSTIHALTVSPVRMELSADPGQTITKNIKLINEQEDARTFYVSFENFTALGETGKPEFLGDDDDLATWVNAPSQVTIEPGEALTVPIDIVVPTDADPGGHFAAIFWGTNPPTDDDSQIAIGGRLGILLLLEVSGDINEAGQIVEFNTSNDNTVITSLPISLYYRFQNTGNVRLKPSGQIEVKNIFGSVVEANIPVNDQQGNVLPQTTRRFELQWGEAAPESSGAFQQFWTQVGQQWSNFKLGPYTMNLQLEYGDGLSDESSIRVYFIPWQLLSVALVVLFLFLVFAKKYNQWIISKAQKKSDPSVSEENVSKEITSNDTNENETVN